MVHVLPCLHDSGGLAQDRSMEPAALIVPLAIATGLGFGCRAILLSKGRSGGAGFCLGFFLGCVGLIIALCLGTTPQFEAQKMRTQMSLMGMTPNQQFGQPQQGFANSPPPPAAAISPAQTWGADPYGRHQFRLFDGKAWTSTVSDNGVVGSDPPVPGVAAPTQDEWWR